MDPSISLSNVFLLVFIPLFISFAAYIYVYFFNGVKWELSPNRKYLPPEFTKRSKAHQKYISRESALKLTNDNHFLKHLRQ